MLLTMNLSILTTYAAYTNWPYQTKERRRANTIMMETVVKAKVGELGEETREVFSRRSRKEMTGVLQEVVGNISYLVRF